MNCNGIQLCKTRSSIPKWNYSFAVNLGYKQFSLNTYFQGAQSINIYPTANLAYPVNTSGIEHVELNWKPELAMEMKVKQIVIHPSIEPIADSLRIEDRSLPGIAGRTFGLLLEKVASLNIECLPRTCLGNTSKEILQILDGIDNIGICFDSNQLLKESPEDFVKAVNKRIHMLHISDCDNVNERHWLPGKGIITGTR
ncbi:sugar phosphate isomerase/epimerase [Dyadobacter sp. CY327]|uniref:sugar phosphate isomerase/epimerase family protein n=1 Tax=Dyadobacter sp. CY327 TaxID=2907301 RepID=UPI001F41C9C8|nr:TIM barrel protein [Dyadobacter sp. CY327]MCE7070840.1 sugar phosphate isomerase/epimerase [Dyadobacter sp. CY327]